MLHFGMSLPFSSEKFFNMCHSLISDSDELFLKGTYNTDIYSYGREEPILEKWRDFNIALNNELVKIRSARMHTDPAKFLRQQEYIGSELVSIVTSAHRNPSLLEGERILDEARWNFLDNLSCGHYFDLGYLIIYVQKLRILERWANIGHADKQALFSQVLFFRG